MAVRPIVTYPDNPILLRRARAVTRVNRRVQRLIDDMLETLHDAAGAGLAAPQVGVGQRVIVVDVGPGASEEGSAGQRPSAPSTAGQGAIVLVNPEIVAAEGEQVGLEGCLSLPDLVGEVPRAERVVVKGLDRRGEPATVEAEGFLARALQHEVDHLDGILFVARVKDPGRLWRASELQAASQEGAVDI